LRAWQNDAFSREEFVVQCKLEARRLAAAEERRQAAPSRDDDLDDDLTLLD